MNSFQTTYSSNLSRNTKKKTKKTNIKEQKEVGTLFPTFFFPLSHMRATVYPISISFALGIFIAYMLIPTWAVWWVIAMALALCCMVMPITFSKSTFLYRHNAISLITLLPIVASGAVAALTQANLNEVDYPKHAGEYDIVIMSEPSMHNKHITAEALIASGAYKGKSVRTSFSRNIFGTTLPCPGDGYRIYCQLKRPTDFSSSNFSFSRYMQVRNIPFVAYVGNGCCKSKAITYDSLPDLQRSRLGAMALRSAAADVYRRQGLEGDALATLSAMTLGDKSMLSKDVKEYYATAGTSHLLALSGTHLTIVFFLVSLVFGRYSRRLPCAVTILLITWTYVIIVGMPPSLLRAAIMLTVFSITNISNRGRSQLNSLSIAALIMMIANPAVVFDVGFQLSVSAVFAIVAIYPRLKVEDNLNDTLPLCLNNVKRWTFNYLFFNLTIFLLTTPLVAYYFGHIPLYFLLSNLIAIPAISIILYLSAAVLLFSYIPAVSQICSWCLQTSINGFNDLLMSIATLPNSYISIPKMSNGTLIETYIILIILFSLIMHISKKL